MTSKEEHIRLSDDFFDLAERLFKNDTYADIAMSAEALLVSLDHLIDAHLAYLGNLKMGRTIRYDRFISDVLEDDTYIIQEDVRSNIYNMLLDIIAVRDSLLYVRNNKVYTVEKAKIKVNELIENVRKYRIVIKNEVL